MRLILVLVTWALSIPGASPTSLRAQDEPPVPDSIDFPGDREVLPAPTSILKKPGQHKIARPSVHKIEHVIGDLSHKLKEFDYRRQKLDRSLELEANFINRLMEQRRRAEILTVPTPSNSQVEATFEPPPPAPQPAEPPPALPEEIPASQPVETAADVPAPEVPKLPELPLTSGAIDNAALADSLFANGRIEEAVVAYSSIDIKQQQASDQQWVKYQLACCHRRLHNLAEAEKRYREVASSNSSHITTQLAKWWLDVLQAKKKQQFDVKMINEFLTAGAKNE